MEIRALSGGKRAMVWFIVFVIIVLGAWWFVSMRGMGTFRPDESTAVVSGETMKGEFPADLLVEDGVVDSESFTLAYTEGDLSRPVVQYVSSKTLAENISMFDSYLRANDWEVLNEASMDESPVTFFYASRRWDQVNVTFTESENGVAVNIAYASL